MPNDDLEHIGELIAQRPHLRVVGSNRHTRLKQINELARIGLSPEDREFALMARLLALCTMPHSDPGERQEHRRSNGHYTFYMQPGPGLGLPYGSYPRLLLAWVTTEAVRTKNPELVLGDSLSDFMRQLGLKPTGGRWGTITRLREQMKRLFSARVSFVYDGPKGYHNRSALIAEDVSLWWDPKTPEQISMWESRIMLGQRFFEEIIRNPIPIDMRVLKALKRSPLGLDLYIWATHRASYLKQPTSITWRQLQNQFGADYTGDHATRRFRTAALRELAKLRPAWLNFRYQTPRGRLLLLPCDPSVPKQIA